MGQGNGRVVLPGQQGVGSRVSVEQAIVLLSQQIEKPPVTEWLELTNCSILVGHLADGQRHLLVTPHGSRRGYRIPLGGISAVQIGQALIERPGQAPEAGQDVQADEPPAPPTMGQG